MTIVFFREQDGSAPFLEWFDHLPPRPRFSAERGFSSWRNMDLLRRPAADYLGDGIYELRAKANRIQYRMLYFFRRREAVVVSHGITKEVVIPPIEIDRARRRKQAFLADPERHTHRETR